MKASLFSLKFLFLSLSLCHAQEQSAPCPILEIKQMDRATFLAQPETEKALWDIYWHAFTDVYKNHWDDAVEKQMRVNFENYVGRFKAGEDFLLTIATENGTTIVGWALFYKHGTRAILEEICVDPQHQRKGAGKQLFFSVLSIWTDVTSIALVTRTVNPISPSFYLSLGCKKTNFSLPEHSNWDMQGFEWTKETPIKS